MYTVGRSLRVQGPPWLYTQHRPSRRLPRIARPLLASQVGQMQCSHMDSHNLRHHRRKLWRMAQPRLAIIPGPKACLQRRPRENTWNWTTMIVPKAVHIPLSATTWSRMRRTPIPTTRIYSQSPHADYLGMAKTSRHNMRQIPR